MVLEQSLGRGIAVTKNVEPYTIVVGVPGKPIKRRFSKEVADRLLEIAWWDWPRKKLESHFDELNDLENFLKSMDSIGDKSWSCIKGFRFEVLF